MSTYISLSRLHVEPERAADLLAAFGRRAHLVDDADGFKRLEVWQGQDPSEVVMVSWWRDRASFTAYMRSADHRCSHARIPQDLDDAIRLERLEHLAGYELAAE